MARFILVTQMHRVGNRAPSEGSRIFIDLDAVIMICKDSAQWRTNSESEYPKYQVYTYYRVVLTNAAFDVLPKEAKRICDKLGLSISDLSSS